MAIYRGLTLDTKQQVYGSNPTSDTIQYDQEICG